MSGIGIQNVHVYDHTLVLLAEECCILTHPVTPVTPELAVNSSFSVPTCHFPPPSGSRDVGASRVLGGVQGAGCITLNEDLRFLITVRG